MGCSAQPAGLVCLMMAAAGFEFADQLPAGIEIDQVVVGKLFAVELFGSCDAAGRRSHRARPAGGDFRRSGGRMRRGAQVESAGRSAHRFTERSARVVRADGAVVIGGGAEGFVGETPFGFAGQLAVAPAQFFEDGA